ncbi:MULTISPECIES: hypothetical protein [Streptomyces]|uniref:hypothetical protein n=1 Tax=Streptomyces TaxID=1883 RepID=UPI0012E284E5|nr:MULTISPECIES: hypothetical protein [Streptomyces]MYS46050.1 hypothetical protein [Streptomyces sp. SID5998]MYX40247.1 hypothetical protein [Streptomyces sp. SID89]NED74487.1 hypothetical protein [Streptomyces sp. SID9944]MBY8869763.1 hypothetical protein [Streptomyces sennicomposti]MYX31497.1 hypothetical protein [Streptomyces sp. SID8381]
MTKANGEGYWGALVGRERQDPSAGATEPLVRDFLDAMSALEADLARRWVGPEARRPAVARPE